jgi:hypothetical protein
LSRVIDELAARSEFLRLSCPRVLDIISRVQAERITFLTRRKLVELAAEVVRLELSGADGVILEAGCALGGSAIVLAAAKSQARPLFLYDVFGLIPNPGIWDGLKAWKLGLLTRLGLRKGHGGDTYYGYRPNLLEHVLSTFRAFGFDPEKFNVVPMKGRHEVTLAAPPSVPVALAHIDSDWFRSVDVAVRAIAPKLVPGGRLVIDDYYGFSGCRRAVDRYFGRERPPGIDLVGKPEYSALHAVRVRDAGV